MRPRSTICAAHVLAASVLLGWCLDSVRGQTGRPAPQGARVWGVFKVPLALEKKKELVAAFPTEPDAKDHRNKLAQASRSSDPWYFSVERLPRDEQQPVGEAPPQAPGSQPAKAPTKPESPPPAETSKPSKKPGAEIPPNQSLTGRFKDGRGRVYLLTESGNIYSQGELVGRWSVAGERMRMDFTKHKPSGTLTLVQ